MVRLHPDSRDPPAGLEGEGWCQNCLRGQGHVVENVHSLWEPKASVLPPPGTELYQPPREPECGSGAPEENKPLNLPCGTPNRGPS